MTGVATGSRNRAARESDSGSTDAGIPPHHNLEEGRKFVIKVDWVQSAASPRHMMCLWLAGEA